MSDHPLCLAFQENGSQQWDCTVSGKLAVVVVCCMPAVCIRQALLWCHINEKCERAKTPYFVLSSFKSFGQVGIDTLE